MRLLNADEDVTSSTVAMPSLGSGWSNEILPDYVLWDVSDGIPFVTMTDILNANWVNRQVTLSGFDAASFSWEEFSALVGSAGAVAFDNLVSEFVDDVVSRTFHLDGKSRTQLRANRVAMGIEDRKRYALNAGVAEENSNAVMLLSCFLAPTTDEMLGWDEADWVLAGVVVERFGLTTVSRLLEYGFTVPQLAAAIALGVDSDLLLSIKR